MRGSGQGPRGPDREKGGYDGASCWARGGIVANPVQFDETPPDLRPAPEHGQHTEELLLELGLDWDDVIRHEESGAIL